MPPVATPAMQVGLSKSLIKLINSFLINSLNLSICKYFSIVNNNWRIHPEAHLEGLEGCNFYWH